MRISDSSSFLDLLEKVRSWISWRTSDMSSSCLSTPQLWPKDVCAECDANSTNIFNGYRCRSCGRWLCVRCVRGYESCVAADESGHSVKFCKFCTPNRKNNQKVHPFDSPRESPEPPSPSFSGDLIHSDRLANYLDSRDCGCSPHAESSRSATSLSAHPSPVSVRRYTSRSDEDEAEDSAKRFYSPSSEYFNDVSDIDSNSISARLDFYHYKSVGSSPLDSPSRSDYASYRVSAQHEQEGSPLYQNGDCDQETGAILRRPAKGTEDQENTDYYSDDTSILGSQYEKPQKPSDYEKNGRIWFPPLPEDENDDAESNFFSYDDDDDDIGESGVNFSSSSSLSSSFPSKERPNEGNKEPIRVMVQGHFRALVAQLLQGEGIKVSKGDNSEDWVDIVTAIAWQAANFVKPDTSRGGSMDPVDYVKVKCVASGSPSDSTLVKGIVCTKNIKHKRMTTQYKNPRLLLLGGALDYQSVVNQLASFNTLVKQENNHLKTIVSKIEALRPNVLLVEKSVSSYAQEYLLAKDISLVLNVKKPLLERIGRCTGAFISPSIGNISSTRLGHCELFRVERVSEEHENVNQFNRKPSKTLMFFEGCPRRLGCTVLLRGTRREELKKVKHVVQYAIFAAHHLSLETSFLADEGASLPMSNARHSIAIPERAGADSAISVIPPTNTMAADASTPESGFMDLALTGSESLSGHIETNGISPVSPVSPANVDCKFGDAPSGLCHDDLASKLGLESFALEEHPGMSTITSPGIENVTQHEFHDMNMTASEERQVRETHKKSDNIVEDEVSSEYFPATDTHQSILVSFSSRCVLKGTVCERSRLLRIKFYGSFDKPLGRYLRDDLFDQTSYCRSCKEPAEAHVLCYTHQQGNLTISVRSLASVKLPGEQDGKIWMWHRCLRCARIDGVPPATCRVIMSDAAWGLSFGKFLELSFTNHTTANRVAPCGHSLQRDCLRFYGFGSMVVFFRYSPIDILNVHLPPSVLEFNGHAMQGFIRKEAEELLGKMETTYTEILDSLESLEQKSIPIGSEFSDINDLERNILELKDQLRMERNDYTDTLQLALTGSSVDILELNRLRRALLIGSHAWGRKLYSLDALLKKNSAVKAKQGDAINSDLKGPRCNSFQGSKLGHGHEENISGHFKPQESVHADPHLEQNEVGLPCKSLSYEHLTSFPFLHDRMEIHSDTDISARKTFSDNITSQTPDLSDRIDSAWTGTEHLPLEFQPLHLSQVEVFNTGSMRQLSLSDNPSLKRAMAPLRVQSFDSALRVQDRIQKGLPPSLYLSTLKSFHASGDYRGMEKDPVSNVTRTYSQILPLEAQKMNLILSSTPSFVSSAFDMAGGAQLLLSQRGKDDVVVGVYDNDPASIISYALSSKEYENWVAGNSNEKECVASTFSTWQSFGSPDLDFVRHGSYGSEDTTSSIGALFMESKKSPHLTVSYGDEYSIAVGGGKVKFSVTCYFAKQFDSLRKTCCPSEVDFIRSLSRCRRWNAQGGKSNVYFAKSLDERFIIKQVIKTELDSFEEFASEYFNYLTDSLSSGSPTCLAKILGIYQVTEKHLKGGKETKRDLVVMENLFFNRKISKVYDLKGSVRARYNTDTTGTDKVLLDMNLMETLRTEPIFLGSKAKRSLERAIWNDTSFLASVDVMDYSLLVGVDEERKELVLGIIDFMRQYTWDKQLETWVKASGILGGPKNAPPTIVSPKQYKRRFRKAMTSYFLTVLDQWSS